MSNGKEAVALKAERFHTVDLIEDVKTAQDLNWDLIYNAISAANETIGKLRDDLMERRIAELAASTYPTLLESVLGMLVSAIPVSRLLEGMYQHLARSFKMRGIVGYMSKAYGHEGEVVKLSPEWAKFYDNLRREKPLAFLQDQRRWVYEIVEYDEAVLKFTAKINPTLEGAIRGKLSAAASAIAKPTVSQEELFSQKAPVKRASTRVTAAPDFLLELRDWVSMSKKADSTAYNKLKTAAERSDDIEQIKATRALVSDESTPSGRPKEFNREVFRRYLEVCILCMTWEFKPRFVPMQRSQTIGSLYTRGLIQPAHFELPPLGDAFWEFAADRYYDPFTGEGDKTYAEVGRSLSLGGGASDDPELEKYAKNAPGWEKGFYPAERLAYHFGNILAPELFTMNRDISQILQGKLRRTGPQSQAAKPTELETFNSYLLGVPQAQSSK